ncbi:RNA polymerase subunit sigma [Lactobacillus taiwanensis]|uniref:RNA polymerase subunit sigma n=1 Tax=Lactobacillus taiwanensis TaxID=508451 RepID=UPI000B99985F|nr:RNA polymerase subunit sigma [Lactobacillus taiwanensis]OYS18460.1 RNA polymerase subunit sigma [Lactobacillus taiwanensis]OYS22963.1 RNA polymerase subunit sigma [Lactobacillus taiwanensis]OYS23656.1 RNA polymerase subunit sigma [Lactobacillus taiwanensis]OYS25680.1 RNA polymerase subunit sigma [Lactobacillus taiwanensis]OYS27128.1 RNA polymerase subunit sigma [Lactobacillus taiwanensis]
MVTERNFIKAWENRRLVAGAIKAAGVRADYQDYADLLQDGVLIYAGMLEESSGEDIDKLAFKKIFWHTLDELRKSQRRSERNEEINNETELGTAEVDWDSLVVLKDEVKKLKEIEWLLFFEHLLGQREVTALVEQAGCSRRTLQRVKKDLLLKLRKVLEK